MLHEPNKLAICVDGNGHSAQCVSLVARYAGLYAVKCSMNFNLYLTPVIHYS